MRRGYRERAERRLRNGCLKDIFGRSSLRREKVRGMLIGRREEIERKREDREEEDILADNVFRG